MSSPLSLENLEMEVGENKSRVPWTKTIIPRTVGRREGDMAVDPIRKE